MSGQVCQICGAAANCCNCQSAIHNLNIGEKLKIKRDTQGNITEVSKEKDCWVITAYYGHPFDPNVCAIRGLRDDLSSKAVVGVWVNWVNVQYQKLGRSRIGMWWASKLGEAEQNIPKVITRQLCQGLLWVVRIAEKRA